MKFHNGLDEHKNFDIFMKIGSVTLTQRSPQDGDGANKNFRAISYHHAKYEWNPSKGLQNMRSYKL